MYIRKGGKIIICDTTRAACGAYKQLHTDTKLLAPGFDKERVKQKQAEGQHIEFADVSSTDFWFQMDLKSGDIEWILLAAPNVKTNIVAATLARHWGYTGYISTSAK